VAEPTRFLNVDLDIYSTRDLQPLAAAFGNKAMVLFVGRVQRTYHAHLELSRMPRSSEAAIRAFCELIRGLPKPARALWNSAKRRELNIGIQAGLEPHATEFRLSPEALHAAQELDAAVTFTVYAPCGELPGAMEGRL
jgi:hypothetical protein